MTTTTDLDLAPESLSETVSPSPARPLAPSSSDSTPREESFSFEPLWNGRPLYPFSLERYTIFLAQRVAMGAPTLTAAINDGNAFYPEALRILWLCSQDPATLRALRRDPEAMQDAIGEWAETHVPISRAAEAVTEALKIFNSAYDNQYETRPSAGGSSSKN